MWYLSNTVPSTAAISMTFAEKCMCCIQFNNTYYVLRYVCSRALCHHHYGVLYHRFYKRPRVLSSHRDNCSLSIAYERHIFPRRDAFDTPVFITSERLARAQRGLAERSVLIHVRRSARAFLSDLDEERRATRDREESKRKAFWSAGIAKLLV